MVSDANANRLRAKAYNLETKVKELEAENEELKRVLRAYVLEFRLCRFCSEIKSDCSPTDLKSCYPRWGGL